jgi:hypothetical protein
MRWLTIIVLAACVGPSDLAAIDSQRVLVHVHELADVIGPRPAGSAGARDAAAYIERELASYGVEVERFPVDGVDLPAIDVLGTRWRDAHHIDTTDPDLLVRFGPPGRALLIMAHYDTVPPSPGAADNSAAVGVLLELARVWHDKPPSQPVVLAFTADEERGLVGAEALAQKRGAEVAFAISIDLIGGSGDLILNGASELIGSAEMRWLADAAKRAGVVVRAPLPHRVISRWWPQAERSDHGAFTRRGVRAIHLYDRGQDGDWIDLAYHSPADVPARIGKGAVLEVGNVLALLASSPVPEPGGDGFWVPLAHDTVVPRWLLVAFDVFLAVLAVLLLARELLRAKGRVKLPGAGLFVGLACYLLGMLAAVGLERLRAGDHQAPWLHAPMRAEVAETLVLIGVVGLATRAVTRFWEWRGSTRYLVVATVLPLMLGVFWIVTGAAELAWIWLVPAVLAALVPRVRRFRWLAIAGTLLAPVLVLWPQQVREAAWNGFLPLSLPLAVWIGALLAPTCAAAAWWFRRPAGPLRTLVLPLGCVLAIAAGVVVQLMTPPPCSGADFQRFSLACELSPTWR